MVHDYLLGGAIVVMAYLAFMLVWSMVEGVVLLVGVIRRRAARRRFSRGGYVRGASVEAVLHDEYVIPWSVWPQESLARFRTGRLLDAGREPALWITHEAFQSANR